MNKTLLRVSAAAALATAAGIGTLVVALLVGGAVSEEVIPGLGDAGALTRWGLPASRWAMDLLAAVTVGALLVAVVLLPLETSGGRGKGRLSASAISYLRGASWLATAWAAAAAATLIFTISDVLGEPAADVVTGNQLSSYVGDLPQGTALMLVVLLSVVVALLARTTATPAGALGLLVVAGIALLPAPLTGHSASAANHSVAVTGLALHVAAVAPWVGGLALLVRHAMAGERRLDVAADRFSRMALWCYIAVGVSGLANLISRLPDPTELLSSDYGRLALGKITAFTALGFFGWWHRRRTLPAVAEGTPFAFARLATVEAAVMAATMGLAVALARTAPPAPAGEESPIKALLGYEMPPEITPGRLATLWQFDFFFAVVVVVLGGAYAAAVVRLRSRGDKWSWVRTASWFFGLLTIVLVTQTGVAKYAPILFSAHMVQHMVLSMLTPIFLVLGAPVTLALRALRPAKIRGDRGPREWLTAALHSRATAIIAHPVVATAIFVVSTFALYFTPLFQTAMEKHLGHIAMETHFLLSGTLFFWVLIGVDPAPKKIPYVGKLLVLFATMPFHAFFGIALMNMSQPIAERWYNVVKPPWGTSILTDQHTGGAIAWAFGEIPTFIVLIALVFQWFVEDQRKAKRLGRKADRENDRELADYNARLAALAEKDQQTQDK